MISIVRASEPDTGAESIVAIPLTVDIFQDALRWFKGKTDAALKEDRTDTGVASLEDGVTAYFNILSKAIPAGTDVGKIQEFIDNHKWPEGSVEKMNGELKKIANNNNMDRSYFLWRFIRQNLARKTKVLGHFVDGNHRAVAQNSALIGVGDDTEGKEAYFVNFTHAEKNVQTTIVIPVTLIDAFYNKMKKLSFSSQKSVDMISKHGRRELFTYLMDSLHYKLGQDCYLYSSNEAVDEETTEDNIHVHIGKVGAEIEILFKNDSEVMMNQDLALSLLSCKK